MRGGIADNHEYGSTELTETHRGRVLVKSYQDLGTLKHSYMRNSSLRTYFIMGVGGEGAGALQVLSTGQELVRGTDKGRHRCRTRPNSISS